MAVVHQKSIGAGVTSRRSAVQATTTTLGRSTGIHLECKTHHNVSETEIGCQTRDSP